uniref:Fibronectin type-III domain-containing protein n=1 Tax=Amphimedon queenslandica TaxID=400682 RepID=A0A1X7U244_AMPQE
MALRSYLFVSTLLFSLGLSHAQLCPSDTFTYSESNCLSLTTSSTPSYDNASASCATDGASLVLISSEGELFAARGYTRSLGVRDGRYWIGYQYSSSNLVDVNGNPAPSIVVSAVEEGGPAPATGVCVALTQNEALVRVLCNESLDGYICQFTINVPLVVSVSFNNSVIDPSIPITQPLGTSFILSCSFNNTTSRSTVQWTLNGAALPEDLIDTNGDMSETTLNVTRFLSEGVYRCQVNNANGRSVGQDIQIYASLEDTFFVPDPLSPNGIVAFPYTQSSILIQWFQPQVSYVSSPLLLRYTLYYTRNRDTDIGDRPVRTNLTTSPSGMGSYVLTGLDVGTEYYLTMSATNRAGTGQLPGCFIDEVEEVEGVGDKLILIEPLRTP